jgi:hypothetical protein
MNILVILGCLLAWCAVVALILRFFANARDWDRLGEHLQEEKWRFYQPPTDKK